MKKILTTEILLSAFMQAGATTTTQHTRHGPGEVFISKKIRIRIMIIVAETYLQKPNQNTFCSQVKSAAERYEETKAKLVIVW